MEYDQCFKRGMKEFCTRFDDYIGKPITYVEVGCWRGNSAHWVCENVLTHQDSKGIGIDPYLPMGRSRKRQMAAAKSHAAEILKPFKNWKWIYNDSKKVLRHFGIMFDDPKIDVLYIDGLHEAPFVLQDFILAWRYLKPGSTVIFDDYGRKIHYPFVRDAVDGIMKSFGGMLEPCDRNKRQFACRVVEKAPPKSWYIA